MPQMSPMNWLMIYMMMLIIMFFMIMINYFNYFNKIKINKFKSYNNKFDNLIHSKLLISKMLNDK